MMQGVTFPENGSENEMLVLLVSKFGIHKKNWAIMLDIGREKCTERMHTIEECRFYKMH